MLGFVGVGYGGCGGLGGLGLFLGYFYGFFYEFFFYGSGSMLVVGGGIIRLVVWGFVIIDGLVGVNVEDGYNGVIGGGSGGSIWILLKIFKGNGVIRVFGGSGLFLSSGGGGGGWILIDFDNCIFSGKIEVFGGVGNKEVGGVGIIYFNNKFKDYE